jgi:putative transposase
VNLSHKIRLYPTPSQESYFCQACGVSRSTYNWALEHWKKDYGAGGKPSAYKLKKQFNAIKRTERLWVLDVTKTAAEQAFLDLERAFKNFFAKRAKYPTWKKKGQRDSFYLGDRFKLDGKRIRIPKLGWVQLAESLRFKGRVLSATVSRTADRWFVSVAVELSGTPRTVNENQVAVVGVDLGISSLAIFSTGEKIAPPKALAKAERRLRRAQRVLARRKKGSANRRKAAARIAKLHYQVKCLRDDFAHKLTTGLVARFGAIVIEDLNVRGMVKNHCLAKAVSDRSFGEVRRQLTYKAALYGRRLVIANRWFPSTKMCSECGFVNKAVVLGVVSWVCPSCGASHDRDRNAAINLSKLPVGCGKVTPVDDQVRPVSTRAQVVEAGMKAGQLCPTS